MEANCEMCHGSIADGEQFRARMRYEKLRGKVISSVVAVHERCATAEYFFARTCTMNPKLRQQLRNA
jgi:GTP cyclohydrolase II